MIDVAHLINDKWDAVWEMPVGAFLGLLRYRRDKAQYEQARAHSTASKR